MIRPIALVLLLSLGLGGCGSSAPPPPSGPPPATGVYISASDCADSGRLDVKTCGALIDNAIAVHYARAPKYISQRLCEVTEGANHCERGEDNQYRPMLQAFLFTFSNPPQAEGLYAQPENGAQAGFQTAAKKKILSVDETVMFSRGARVIAAGNGV